MSARDWLDLTAPAPVRPLGEGKYLRVLPIHDLQEARREALALAEERGDLPLCSNACLVAKAVVGEGGDPLYPSGRRALEELTEGEIEELARQWAALDREEDGWQVGMETWKETLARLPRQRLRWRVLRTFGALPTERRAREMTDRDYLWCAVNLLLDREGRERDWHADPPEENPGFDMARFLALKEGDR
jgi:hypothetical protein